LIKLMEVHGDGGSGEDGGKAVKAEAPLVETIEGSGGRL